MQQATSTAQCRRRIADRRQAHIKAMYYSLFMNRRKHFRRVGDLPHQRYVDCHEPLLLVLVLTTSLLCVADAFLTLDILSRGGRELNPFMDVLIRKDVLLFFSVKFVLTSFGLVFVVAHKHFRLFRLLSGYQILYATFGMYATLVAYELLMLA